jgi:hypothetical protein
MPEPSCTMRHGGYTAKPWSDILAVDGHVISDKSLEYHNERIFGSIGTE